MIEKYEIERNIKTYQCDRFGILRPVMLMNELQSIIDKHAKILGYGRSYCIENNLAWVVTHYLIDIIESPREGEKLKFVTWPVSYNGVKTIHDFEARGTNNRLMVRATSQWVLIDMITRRPLKVFEHFPNLDVLPTRALDLPFGKFPDFIPTMKTTFSTRYDDIDGNQHINNSVYATWAAESLGKEFRSAHHLQKMHLNFKHEITPEIPKVSIESALNGNISNHTIKTGDQVNAQVVFEWANNQKERTI